jgi:FdhD protein
MNPITVTINKVSRCENSQSLTTDLSNKTLSDNVTPEEPLSVILNSYTDKLSTRKDTVMTTMRTPGNDTELVKGWLNTQNFINEEEFDAIVQKVGSNLCTINAKPSYRLDPSKLTRLAPVSSSCGICNDTEINNIIQYSKVKSISNICLNFDDMQEMINSLFREGSLFYKTGGSHSCAIFPLVDGEVKTSPLRVREDVGRHNALDKLIGSLDIDEMKSTALLLSGRVSADLMQKVICAGIPLVLAIGAPSSLAIELAESVGVVLIGFIKHDSFNIYAGTKQLNIKN